MELHKKHLSAAIAIALTLILAATFITALPTAFGQTVDSYSFVFAYPPTVGLGEAAYIVGWIIPPPSRTGDFYYNFTFTITRPDGTTVDKFFPKSLTDATRSFNYVCDQEGTWRVVLSWPGGENR